MTIVYIAGCNSEGKVLTAIACEKLGILTKNVVGGNERRVESMKIF